MSATQLPVNDVNGVPLNQEQQSYLGGFFAGLQARGVTYADAVATPAEIVTDGPPLIFEERIKKEEHPLESFYRLAENARQNKAPDKEETFRFKWHGLFYLSPVKDAFMARLRIPGGQLKTFQWREIAQVAKDLTSGYVQITTRANFQVRLIEPQNAPEFLRRIQSVGLHARGSGADNIRNLTANPTAGIDPHELYNTGPLCLELGQYIISHREFYDLPRKFNIAFDGGGLIGSVEDTNDIGWRAVRIEENAHHITPGVYFRCALGGATGHKSFARDLGILVKPEEVIKVTVALLRVYIAHGNRTDRKKARLKHLLDKWTLDQYLAETDKLLGTKILRSPADFSAALSHLQFSIPHSHVGIFPQKQAGLHYVGVAMPVGQITPEQMLQVADLADEYGSGELRLTVWQNFLIPNVPAENLEPLKKGLKKIGLGWQQSNLSSGFISCTGNRYCKFSSADTKGHAIELMQFLEKKFDLDQPINVHFTGCPNSCAQHYMGDLGFLGTKVQGDEGYHVFIGGGFGTNQALGRQLFQGVRATDLSSTVSGILRGYLQHRTPGETFLQFTLRHDLNTLQQILAEP